MAMLDYSEVREHKYIIHDTEPWEVLSCHIFRMQMRKPVNQTKLRNLISGRVVEITFHQNDKVPEAEIEEREVKYLYANRGEYWFCDPNNPKDRFVLPPEVVGENIKFVKVNSVIGAVVFNDAIFALKLPAKVELKVLESAPAVRGNTSGNATKIVTLEGGATVNVPMFINEGDIIRVNIETGQYAERVEKA